jgi:hypothetical protein
MRRRHEFTKIWIALKKIFLKNRKEHLIKKIINLLRDKSFDEIDAFKSLSLLQRVDVLLSTLIVESQIFLTLREMNIRLKNLERNIAKIIFILFIYRVRIEEHFFEYMNTSLEYRDTLREYMLYSRQTCRFITYKVAKFIKLIKRFRFLQVWLKLSDIWRCLSDLKWELFEAFSKIEILMFFDKRTLKK